MQKKKKNYTITKYSSAYKWYVRVTRNLESKRLLNSCRLTVCKYPPVGNSLILIIVQKSRHFKLLIGVSYERMFNWKLTRREPDLCKWHCVFNHSGVWERKESGKKRVRGTIGKKSALFFPWTWVLWLVGVVLLCHHGHWPGLHSFLIRFGFPLFSRKVESDQAESLKPQGAPGCNTSLYICCNENFFMCQRMAWTTFLVKSTGIWFCSNQLEIPLQMIRLIETSGSLMCGLASVISSLKTHSGSWDCWVNQEGETASCSVSFSWLLWWHQLLAFFG